MSVLAEIISQEGRTVLATFSRSVRLLLAMKRARNFLFCLLFGLVASVHGEDAGSIAISVLTMNNPFFKEIVDNITSAAKAHNYSVIATSADFDVAKQQNQIKDFIVKKVSAIVLCPADSKAIGPAIREANAAGIPVFTADIASLDPEAKGGLSCRHE